MTSPPYYGHRHYGENNDEVGQEKTDEQFINKLIEIFTSCADLLTEDGSLWIVIGDTRRNNQKLLIPHRFALTSFFHPRKIVNALKSSSIGAIMFSQALVKIMTFVIQSMLPQPK